MTQREKRITWPVVVVVVTGAVVVLAGGLIAWLRPGQLLPGGVPVGAGVHLYAERMAARSIPIGVGLLVLLWLRERHRQPRLGGVVWCGGGGGVLLGRLVAVATVRPGRPRIAIADAGRCGPVLSADLGLLYTP
jgi:hypothetical protein